MSRLIISHFDRVEVLKPEGTNYVHEAYFAFEDYPFAYYAALQTGPDKAPSILYQEIDNAVEAVETLNEDYKQSITADIGNGFAMALDMAARTGLPRDPIIGRIMQSLEGESGAEVRRQFERSILSSMYGLQGTAPDFAIVRKMMDALFSTSGKFLLKSHLEELYDQFAKHLSD